MVTRQPSPGGMLPRQPSPGCMVPRQPSSGGMVPRQPSPGGMAPRQPSPGGMVQRGRVLSGGRPPANHRLDSALFEIAHCTYDLILFEIGSNP